MGISTTHMSHIETGNTKMRLPIFAALDAASEVRTDELLYDDAPEGRSAALALITELLDGCTTPQVRVIEDIVKAAKGSFQANA